MKISILENLRLHQFWNICMKKQQLMTSFKYISIKFKMSHFFILVDSLKKYGFTSVYIDILKFQFVVCMINDFLYLILNVIIYEIYFNKAIKIPARE